MDIAFDTKIQSLFLIYHESVAGFSKKSERDPEEMHTA